MKYVTNVCVVAIITLYVRYKAKLFSMGNKKIHHSAGYFVVFLLGFSKKIQNSNIKNT